MIRSFSAKELTFTAVGIALIAVCSWISVPMTIPFTMQTFAVCLAAAVLGLLCGVWAVVGYLLLIGPPCFRRLPRRCIRPAWTDRRVSDRLSFYRRSCGGCRRPFRHQSNEPAGRYGIRYRRLLCVRYGVVYDRIRPPQRTDRFGDGSVLVRASLPSPGHGQDRPRLGAGRETLFSLPAGGEKRMIRDRILAELWRSADACISGEELASRLGVSRTAVWKTIRQLRGEGYHTNP